MGALPALKTTGITTPFWATLPAGSYVITFAIVDVSSGGYHLATVSYWLNIGG